ncbi:MAG: DUF91 domain-containing protein [Armatimonadetes bacterium]|nr:DUF91 domain-containing protein [Armatimonadota bacterium]
MAIYEKPVRLLMRDMLVELAPDATDSFTSRQAHSWFESQYPKIKRGTVQAHLVRLSTNHPTRVHYSPRPDGSDDVFFQIDRGRFRRYDPERDPPPITRADPDPLGMDESDQEQDETEIGVSASEFAYESDLRDFLARNLDVIEPGLRLYEEDGQQGVEYPAGGRFIDILSLDREGRFVIVDLKVSKGYDRVVGQLLRYVGWVRQNLADPGQEVRGLVIAREISDDLRLACSVAPNIELFAYELELRLKRVG